MNKALFIGLLLCTSAAFADGPLFKSSNTYTQQEFENVYWDIRNPQIDSGNAKILNITTSTIESLTVSTITAVSSATITSLRVGTIIASSGTITTLTVTTITYAGFTAYTPWVSYTPTFTAGFGTVTDIQMYWRQTLDTIEIRGAFKVGTVAASEANFSIPSGKVIDFDKVPDSIASIALAGIWYGLQNGGLITNTAFGPLFSDGSNNGRIFFALNATGGSGLVKANANALTLNNQYVLVKLSIPVTQ